MTRARDIANFGDGIATTDIDDGAVTAAKIGSLPAGSVLQVLQGTSSTETTFTSTSFIGTTTSVSITPTSTSSKILVTAVLPIQNSTGLIVYTLYRDAVNLGDSSSGLGRWYVTNSDTNATMLFLDSPSTTSATTYTVRVRVTSGTGYYNIANEPSSIVVQEIAG